MAQRFASEDKEVFPFDIELQYHILNMMLCDEHFLIKCLAYIEKEYFENSTIAWFFKITQDHYEKYSKTIDKQTIKNEILRFSEIERQTYFLCMERIFESKYSDEEYLKEQLTGWLRRRQFALDYRKIGMTYNQGRHSEAYEITSKSIEQIQEINFLEDSVIHLENIDHIIESAHNSSRRKIPLGIPEFDSATLGGIPRQGLTTILGVTNSGKSVMLMNIAYQAIMKGYKVLYIYHEGSDDQTAFRFMSRFTRIPYFKFYAGLDNFNDIEKKTIDNAKALLKENLVLKNWQSFGVTIEDFYYYCKHKKADFDFDMVICDYGQLLKVKSKGKYDEQRHDQAAVYRGLSTIGAELDVAVVSAAQGNRAADIGVSRSKTGRLLTNSDIAECYEIIRCSECVFTITRTKEDEVNNVVKLLLSKQREGKVGIAVQANTDFSRMVMFDEKLGIYPYDADSDGSEVDIKKV